MIYNKPRDISFGLMSSQPKRKKEKQKTPKRAINKTLLVKALSFFLMLYVGTVFAFIIPLRPTYSESEKRELTKFPEYSTESLLDGSYFDTISLWFSDTFPLRESLTKFNTLLKSFYGFDSMAIHGDLEVGDDIPDIPEDIEETTEPATEETMPAETTEEVTQSTQPQTTEPLEKPDIKTQSLGAILIAGDSGYEYYNFSNTLAPEFIRNVNSIKSASGNKSNVYSMIIPTSMDITLNDAIRADINSSDQKKALDYFNGSFKDCTPVTGIYESLRNHRNEYVYFRTDHHWTALGAYYAYEQFANAKGVTPVSLSSYSTASFDNFLGTFYINSGQSDALSKTPDTVVAYLPSNNTLCTVTESNGTSYKWDVISDVSSYSSNLKYLTFIGGDQAIVEIENLDITEGETCVVIKESYGNAFVPHLIPHYKKIYVIDPRHYNGTLSGFTQDKEIDDILFIANISTTRNSVYIDAMNNFIR